MQYFSGFLKIIISFQQPLQCKDPPYIDAPNLEATAISATASAQIAELYECMARYHGSLREWLWLDEPVRKFGVCIIFVTEWEVV